MDVFKNNSYYSIPVYFKDQANDLKNIEAEANRALQNIDTLYKEIMHTNSQDNIELGVNVDSSESRSSSTPSKHHCTINVRKFAETSRKFHFISQLPLSRCSHCSELFNHNHESISTSTCRTISTEDKLNCESEIDLSKERVVQNSKTTRSSIKITVPQPFSLSGYDKKRLEAKQHKLDQLKAEKEREIEKELKVKVVSKPAPKHTHLRLYNEMVEKNERRKTERREESLKVIGKASKPLNDCAQINSKHRTSPVILTNELKQPFKATPVPKNILSNKVTEKLKTKEEIRKMLIAHRAEEMLKQSSSPLSKKTIPRSYSMLNLSDCNKDFNEDKGSKANISAITNRLYVKKCKETLNDWNKKVMSFSLKENESKSSTSILNKLKPQPEQLLPFLYYPVRMSTATSLRNRQIRSEILAREKREEQYQNNETRETLLEMHEEISKKLHKLLPLDTSEKEIEDKVKGFRDSQLNREEEYERELEEMMRRVSQQYLLIERQSKKGEKKVGKQIRITDEEESSSLSSPKSNHTEKESSTDAEQSENSESHSE